MKGNKKILVVAVLLLLITVTFSTYAIYKSSVTANGTVNAAVWDISFKDGATEITSSYTIQFSTSECTNNAHVKDGVIAPGATCTKTITLDAGDSEVDVAYAATAGTVTATKGGSAVSTSGANAFTVDLSPASGWIDVVNGTTTEDIEVSISWAGTDDSDTDTVNSADTSLNGATLTVPITLVAKQKMGS